MFKPKANWVVNELLVGIHRHHSLVLHLFSCFRWSSREFSAATKCYFIWQKFSNCLTMQLLRSVN